MTTPTLNVARQAPRGEAWLLGLALVFAMALAWAEQAPKDVDVKYSDLYRDLVFEEKSENWRREITPEDDWRAAQPEAPEPRARFSAGFDPQFEEQRQAQYFRSLESSNRQNDPQPSSLLRWDFR